MNNVDITKTTTHLSLCSGYEGIGMGLRGIFPALREIAHVEIEAYAIANLVEKMEKSLLPPAPIYTDIKTFPFASFRGCVDILSGGFPCQPFSTAGKRRASEDPRHLWPYIKDGIGLCRPRMVLLENVEGIISAKMPDGQSVLHHVLTELEGLGYRATAGVFSAAEVGASHQRKRVFILGVADTANRRTGRERIGDETQLPELRDFCGLRPIARPGEEQFAHEEPRTKPKLGRAANVPSNRLDRLRACGNGVVPATAERAFRVLINRITSNK